MQDPLAYWQARQAQALQPLANPYGDLVENFGSMFDNIDKRKAAATKAAADAEALKYEREGKQRAQDLADTERQIKFAQGMVGSNNEAAKGILDHLQSNGNLEKFYGAQAPNIVGGLRPMAPSDLGSMDEAAIRKSFHFGNDGGVSFQVPNWQDQQTTDKLASYLQPERKYQEVGGSLLDVTGGNVKEVYRAPVKPQQMPATISPGQGVWNPATGGYEVPIAAREPAAPRGQLTFDGDGNPFVWNGTTAQPAGIPGFAPKSKKMGMADVVATIGPNPMNDPQYKAMTPGEINAKVQGLKDEVGMPAGVEAKKAERLRLETENKAIIASRTQAVTEWQRRYKELQSGGGEAQAPGGKIDAVLGKFENFFNRVEGKQPGNQ